MKIRKSFVSNSSSTSFLCEVCDIYNENDDEETLECGHVMCPKHVLKIRFKILKEYLLKEHSCSSSIVVEEEIKSCKSKEELIDSCYYYIGFLPRIFCPICNLKTIKDETLLRYLLLTNNKKRKV